MIKMFTRIDDDGDDHNNDDDDDDLMTRHADEIVFVVIFG